MRLNVLRRPYPQIKYILDLIILNVHIIIILCIRHVMHKFVYYNAILVYFCVKSTHFVQCF